MIEGLVSLELGLRVPDHCWRRSWCQGFSGCVELLSAVLLAHLSTAARSNLVARLRLVGVKVTCETCPHYFTL
jgi:dihydroorotase-like cyclic amidohydrolase